MLITYKDASYRPKGQGERGYGATKTGAVSANRCQYHASRSIVTE